MTLDRLDERLAGFAKRTDEKLEDLKRTHEESRQTLNAVNIRLGELESRERERNGQLYSLAQWRKSHEDWANELALEVGRMEEATEVTALVSKTKRGVLVTQAKVLTEALRLFFQGGVLAAIIFVLHVLKVL